MGMKANGGFFTGTNGNPIAGDATFMDSNDGFLKNIRKRKDVDPNGQFDIIAHGVPDAIEVEHNGKKIRIDSRTAAKLIRKMPGYNKKNIRLLSCNTGYLNHGFAQNLANKLNVTVWAPNNLLWVWPNGNHIIAPRLGNSNSPDTSKKGRFIKFTPGGNKK